MERDPGEALIGRGRLRVSSGHCQVSQTRAISVQVHQTIQWMADAPQLPPTLGHSSQPASGRACDPQPPTSPTQRGKLAGEEERERERERGRMAKREPYHLSSSRFPSPWRTSPPKKSLLICLAEEEEEEEYRGAAAACLPFFRKPWCQAAPQHSLEAVAPSSAEEEIHPLHRQVPDKPHRIN